MRCVLVIDGDQGMRAGAVRHLERRGYLALTAGAGDEALRVLRAARPEVVLLDLGTTRHAGLQALRAVLDLDPTVGVIATSEQADLTLAVDAMKLGALEFLSKPVEPSAADRAVALAGAFAEVRRQIAAARRGEPVPDLAGDSLAMERIRTFVARVAPGDEPVLLPGERGAGKDAVAEALFRASTQAPHPFLKVSCADQRGTSLDDALVGGGPGPSAGGPGAPDALRWTVLLDGVEDLDGEAQGRLVAFLERRGRERGGPQSRILATTSADLERLVADGRFRRHLLARLAALRITIPPLRERPEDVPALAARFICEHNARGLGPVAEVGPSALVALMRHAWPGNAWDLASAIAHAFVRHGTAGTLRLEQLPAALRDPVAGPPPQGAPGSGRAAR